MFDRITINFYARIIRAHWYWFRIIKLTSIFCYIFWNIYNNRTWSPSSSNIKSFFYCTSHVFNICNHKIMLYTWPCNTHSIYLLKGIVTYQCGSYLPGENNNWNRIHICISNTCNWIGSPRARSYKNYAWFIWWFSKTFCCMHSTLFMSY